MNDSCRLENVSLEGLMRRIDCDSPDDWSGG